MPKQISSSLSVLSVADLERSRAYYRDVLGFDVTDWWAERDGLTGLALKLHQAPDPSRIFPNPPEPGSSIGIDVSAYVENWAGLDSLYQEFKSKGAIIAMEPVVYADGGPWKEFVIEDPDGYHLAFGGIDGSREHADDFPEALEDGEMNVEIIGRPEMKAAVLRIPRDGHQVREAWKKVASLLEHHPAVTDREHGYVFIPEWQWSSEVTTLWVGMAVEHFDGLPDELEQITIPAKRFARLRVDGDRTRMEQAYGYLFKWFEQGPYERDMQEGSFGYEMNRLQPINPFEIPADEINYFDYDIYAPIKEDSKFLASDRYPGVINVEIRQGRTRKIIGVEMFVDRKQTIPEQAIPKMWGEFMPRIGEIMDVRQPLSTVGLYLYEPPFGPHQDFRYVAAVEVGDDSNIPIPDGMTELSIPNHDCVVITYRGTSDGLGQVWDYFHGHWFPQQTEYDAVHDFEFERHDQRFLGTNNENSVLEMHFPVRKRLADKRLTDKTVVDEKGGHVLQDLRGENVRMVSFQDAVLHGIDLRNARLSHVNFVGSHWEHIYFSNVHIIETQLGGTVFEHIRRPDVAVSQLEGEPGTEGWVNVEPVIFRNSDLSTAKFENCNLSEVDIQNCQLDGMRINGIPVTALLEHYFK